MRRCHPVPRVVLLTDARNDHRLEWAVSRMPRGSALVFRHYHLPIAARRARFEALRRLCARRGVLVITAGEARGWRADGHYGAPRDLGRGSGLRPRQRPGLHLATAHSLAEIGAAVRARACAILLSPVFPTRSHPGAPVLGPVRFLLLARRSPLPIIALGGMTKPRAARLPVWGWAAIDGLA
ncbi:thiamine phosphate synthase [Novosphingobium sp.]|jgi:thiamine-phosphate pyrophosphorylase|uniref:thiamine phosphate synthase n=1 Tax=Novosphingobium sp. TaxID=1874826 RepID=UPI00261F3576|nr:thiamine phosphate synthase [Novosphingobium sp.]